VQKKGQAIQKYIYTLQLSAALKKMMEKALRKFDPDSFGNKSFIH
jgi:hypothetical protein